MKPKVKKEVINWKTGDLVCAKVKGHPAWPAQVRPSAFSQGLIPFSLAFPHVMSS